ncbi:cytochrome p450 [Seiridium cupressi]
MTIAATIWICQHITNWFWSPFVSIPAAHPLANFTSLWIEWQRFQGTDFQSISKAFANKGPYVRLGPRELAVNDIEAVGCIWGVGVADFDKHPSYNYWKTLGTSNTFTSVLGDEHRRHHRRIRGVHNRLFISSSPHVRSIMRVLMTERLLPLLDQISTSADGTANVLPIAQSITLDCTSAFAFGLSLSLNFILDTESRQQWFNLFGTAFPTDRSSFWLREHPQLTKYLCFLGIPIVSRKTASARREFEAWALSKVDAAELVMQRHAAGQLIPEGDFPILYSAVRKHLAVSERGPAKETPTQSVIERRERASECLDHIAFTGEAFGTVYTYMLYELSRHADIQRELHDELCSVDNPLNQADRPADICTSETLERLPLLGAVIKECLRLRNTSPNADPRVTPARGVSRIGSVSGVPPNTRVCSYGWCLHRNPDVYTDPLCWNPKRWLEGSCDNATAAKKWFFAFGAGSRSCIGQNIALELFRVSLATVYTRYATSVADESNYPGANEPMSPALTDKLFIKFEKRY